MEVSSSMTLSGTTWSENVSVKLAKVTGNVKSLNIAFDADCTSACKMAKKRPWAGATTLRKGQQASGKVTYKATPPQGGSETLKTKYHMYVTMTGAIPVRPNTNWENPQRIRCDKEVGNGAGCVYPDIRANFALSLRKYGAAAATYLWAQQNLPDKWGDRTSLRRMANEAAAEANRRRTCKDGTFDEISEVPNDSCDEFPFAKTYDGGTRGELCADILPRRENGKWFVYEARADKPVKGTEKCVRGHVPLPVNTAAGGELGRFAVTQRVLDTEKYTMTVTE
ncbi:NucA/NucB deoxyribonuclease domain-containing protein [Streptomyces decoyicus]